MEDDAGKSATWALACEYLEALSYVCQMQLETRDFTLAACSQDMRSLWQHDTGLLADVRGLLLSEPSVGLLSRVDNETYRFSHLTLQEYLAAKCAVRLYGHDAEKLAECLAPFHSRWRREVLQFTACLLKEEVFEAFCRVLMARDDGAGANCELVRAFLKERTSATVEQLLRDRLLELRGADNLIAGLCHPSAELRRLLLSEIRQFQTPADPFSDGTAARLKQIVEDVSSQWYRRRAALLSLAQVAQMKHYAQGSGRADTLRWMIKMLDAAPEVRRDIHVALVRGLGSLLQGSAAQHEPSGCMELGEADEHLLIQALEGTDSLAAAEAIADLQLHSSGFADWLLSDFKSHLISEGRWPLRHVVLLCERAGSSESSDDACDRVARLAQTLVARLYSAAFDPLEHEQLMGALRQTIPLISVAEAGRICTDLMVTGSSEQRRRVLEAMAALGIGTGILPGLVDWLVSKPDLVTKDGWPMQDVMWICDRICASGDKERAGQLGKLVLDRLHAPTFKAEERPHVTDALRRLQALGIRLPVLNYLEDGDGEQRVRVLETAAAADLAFEAQLLGKLAKCLLQDAIKVIPAGAESNTKTALCKYFIKGDCSYGARCHFAHGKAELKMCNDWVQGTCARGGKCRLQHGAASFLLVQILEKEGGNKNSCSSTKVSSYLENILRPAADESSVQRVLARLRPSMQQAQARRQSDAPAQQEPQGAAAEVANALLALVEAAPDGQVAAAQLCSSLYRKSPDARAVVQQHKGLKGFLGTALLRGKVEFIADQVRKFVLY